MCSLYGGPEILLLFLLPFVLLFLLLPLPRPLLSLCAVAEVNGTARLSWQVSVIAIR